MKKIIDITTEDDTEWLYVPDVVYHEYENTKRHLQMIIPYKREWKENKLLPSTVLLGIDQIEGNEELAKKASCCTYVTDDISLPPILLMHSQDDPVVSVKIQEHFIND